MSIKQIVFDACLLVYSAALGIYAISDIDQTYFESNFSSIMGIFLGLCVFAIVISALLHRFGVATVGEVIFSRLPARRAVWWKVHAGVLLLGSLAVSIQVTEASIIELLDRDGIHGAVRLWGGISNPNFNILPRAIAEAIETVFIAFLATVIAVPLAFVWAFFCAKNLMSHPGLMPFYSVFRLILNVSRSIEPLIWALIFTVWVGVGPFAGMLALMIHSVVSLAKYYSEIIENVEDGPLDGIRSTGANTAQVVWFAVVPQILMPYISMTIYRWDTNVRMATVIGLVGGGGIGTLLIQYQGQAQWREVGCIILVIALIVWLMDTASAYVREALK